MKLIVVEEPVGRQGSVDGRPVRARLTETAQVRRWASLLSVAMQIATAPATTRPTPPIEQQVVVGPLQGAAEDQQRAEHDQCGPESVGHDSIIPRAP